MKDSGRLSLFNWPTVSIDS